MLKVLKLEMSRVSVKRAKIFHLAPPDISVKTWVQIQIKILETGNASSADRIELVSRLS